MSAIVETTQLNEKAIAVEVPGRTGLQATIDMGRLPEGNWQILGLAHELDDRQCKQIMDCQYCHDSWAKTAFDSLMEWKGLTFESKEAPVSIDKNPITEDELRDLKAYHEHQQKVKTYLILVKE